MFPFARSANSDVADRPRRAASRDVSEAPVRADNGSMVTTAPDTIDLERDRDLVGREHELWWSRGRVLILCLIPLLALVNFFGQRPSDASVSSGAARLALHAPSRLRGGDIFEARFHISANEDLRGATLVLDPGWLEGLTMNTVEPAPVDETSSSGRLHLKLGDIAAGDTYVLTIQLQVNPTTVGRRSQDVRLISGGRELVKLERTLTVFP